MSQGGASIDFARLYAELGVAPEGGLEAFKRAYRRRVAELHPDRPATAPRDPALLVALNLGYAAVLDFHRGQGRIPGQPVVAPAGPPPPPAASGRAPPDASRPPPAPRASAMRRPEVPPRRTAPRIRVLLVPVLLAIAAIWRWLPEAGPHPGAADAPPTQPASSAAATLARVQLGMDRDTVALLLGEPVARDADDNRWIYGPSWLRFECGRLADWYSSPLHPLRVESRRPRPQDLQRHAPAGGACPKPAHALAKRPHGAP